MRQLDGNDEGGLHFQSSAWHSQRIGGIIKGVLLYVIIGIAIGGLIHGYVPEGFFRIHVENSWFADAVVGRFGVPMYANAAGIVPVIEVFVAKVCPSAPLCRS